MSNCPFCQHPGAYDSGFTVECANTKCSRFSQRQFDEFSGPAKSLKTSSEEVKDVLDVLDRALDREGIPSYEGIPVTKRTWASAGVYEQEIRYTGPVPPLGRLGVWMGPVERVGKIPPRQEIPIRSEFLIPPGRTYSYRTNAHVPHPSDVSEPRVSFEQRVRRLAKEYALASVRGLPTPPLPYDMEATQTGPTTVVFRQKSCLEILEELRRRGHHVSNKTWLAAVDDLENQPVSELTVEF